MRAGSVSAAALRAMPVPCTDEPAPQHCPRLEYIVSVAQQAINPHYRLRKIRFHRNFLEQWPHLPTWFVAPLAERVGRIRGEDSRQPSFPTSYLARSYLVFLGLRGYARFDYPGCSALSNSSSTDRVPTWAEILASMHWWTRRPHSASIAPLPIRRCTGR